MLLTLTTLHRPATDLGYLLHKNPEKVQSFELSFGRAHVFYPEAREERCSAALLLDVDAVGLVRNRKGPTMKLSDLLSHLYVLVPVLDDDKHYWVGEDEVEKLLRHGEGWLAGHPEREAIAYRYLKHRRGLVRQTIARLVEEDQQEVEEEAEAHAREEDTLERRISLNEERLGAVLAALKGAGARRVLDLGCGEGKLVRALLGERQFEEVVGVDVSSRTLERAAGRLNLDRMPPLQRRRVKLVQGSLTYRDRRLEGFDAAAVVEVIEHLDPPRLAAFSRVLFECARPGTVVLTTPNVEYNVRFEGLAPGKLRHGDHRFEWTRAEFEQWSEDVAGRFGYAVRRGPIGPTDPEVGSPTQMAVFTRQAAS